jgi:REP element-mobilizing transposase RayT
MARPLRLELPGARFHVFARGDNRQDIYRDDVDRQLFMAGLGTVTARLQWRLWAYCLMSNHYHLLVETPGANLSRGMRDLNGAYSQRFNRRHGRVGHVFQGRFKATLVERESYLLELSRYIVNNPVRSGLCEHAGDWPWSSFRDVMGWREPSDSHLMAGMTLALFAADLDRARRLYQRFVFQGAQARNPLTETRHQVFLGDAGFVAAATRQARRPSREVPRAQRAWKSLEEIAGEHSSRNAAIAAAYRDGHHPVTAIARHFDLHSGTVGRIARREAGPQPPSPRRVRSSRSLFKT